MRIQGDKTFIEHAASGQVYREKCQCGKTIEIATQKDDYPEYYTDICVKCDCGKSVEFLLPVNQGPIVSIEKVKELVAETKAKFVAIAPKNMSHEREVSFAFQLLSANEKLKQAAISNPSSLQKAVINVASVGLSLNPVKKQAYLINRNIKVQDGNGRDRWVPTVCLEPSYMGLCDLATQSGMIDWVQAKCVYKNDTYVSGTPGVKPKHDYEAFGDRGEFVGCYSMAKTAKGDYLVHEMSADQIYSIRDRSEAWKAFKAGKTKTGGPWGTDPEKMYCKTAVRSGFSMWPKAPELSSMSEAVHLSNENEGFEPLISEPNIAEPTADQKGYFDQLIEQNDALGMYCFYRSFGNDASSPEAAIWVSLTHSFPKGQKGKYQAVVNELRSNGENQYIDIEVSITDALESGDDSALQEILGDLSDNVVALVESSLNSEQIHMYNEFKGAA